MIKKDCLYYEETNDMGATVNWCKADREIIATCSWCDEYVHIDLVPVVRCKDCWYSSVIPEEMQNVGEWHCEYWCAEMHGNDFCSCGKEKTK